MSQFSFTAESDVLRKLSSIGDPPPLEKLDSYID